jgi:hypothetical protein
MKYNTANMYSNEPLYKRQGLNDTGKLLPTINPKKVFVRLP